MPLLYLLKKIPVVSTNILGPTPQTVFADRVDENADWFLPLLSVELSKLNPEWKGLVHFVYHEANSNTNIYSPELNTMSGVSFRLENNKYVYEGTYDFDDQGMAERERVEGHIGFVAVEVRGSVEDWSDTIKEKVRADDQPASFIRGCCLGGSPVWTQGEEVPKNPDGEDMAFIGQIRADYFSEEVADKDLYLFYCPKHQIVTQVDQQT